jgi:hypothetical protein
MLCDFNSFKCIDIYFKSQVCLGECCSMSIEEECVLDRLSYVCVCKLACCC